MPDSSAVARRGSQPAGSVVAVARSLPRRYPRTSFAAIVWVITMYCALLARPPAITEEQTQAFRAKIKEAEGVLVDLTTAERQLMDAQMEMRQHQVWFWRWKPEARREVEARQPAVDAAQQRVDGIQRQRDWKLREAKAALGLWSEAGVEEGRELFWDSFASGKVFAQRQSFIDAVFSVLGGQERDWLSLLLRLLLQTLVNFFAGMTVAVFVFLFQLPGLIWSYQPALWSAVAFFSLAAVCAVSVIASYLGLLFGAGAAVTYATVSLVAQQQQRLEAAQQQRQQIDWGREHDE